MSSAQSWVARCTRHAPKVCNHAQRMASSAAFRYGTPVARDLLNSLGFSPYVLRFRAEADPEPFCEWDTEGEVPDASGIYAFVLSRSDWPQQHVAYVGKTRHLWMVTKGMLPGGGGARPGNRYGRPKYAGSTRVRINSHIAVARRERCEVTHWLSPCPDVSAAQLSRLEEDLIVGWDLRATGWNVG
jgi:hypothetical protein